MKERSAIVGKCQNCGKMPETKYRIFWRVFRPGYRVECRCGVCSAWAETRIDAIGSWIRTSPPEPRKPNGFIKLREGELLMAYRPISVVADGKRPVSVYYETPTPPPTISKSGTDERPLDCFGNPIPPFRPRP